MTNEEAIEAIKCNSPDSRYTILREALDMAISALRQQEHFREVTKKVEPLTMDELREMPIRDWVWIEILKSETVTNRSRLNAPLTLEELTQMDGEPVWIKLFDPDEEFWVLRNEWVDTRNPEPMILFRMRWYSHSDYGKTWLAYRQKPEEGTV